MKYLKKLYDPSQSCIGKIGDSLDRNHFEMEKRLRSLGAVNTLAVGGNTITDEIKTKKRNVRKIHSTY